MAAELHLHDGAAWRKAKEVHIHDGTAWRKAKEVFIHDGTAWRKVFTGAAVVPAPFIRDLYSSNAFTAQLGINIGHDGLITLYDDGGTEGVSWFEPNTASVGATYYGRLFVVSGTDPAGSGTWRQLNASRNFEIQLGASQTASGVWRVDIATDAAGANVVSSSNPFAIYASTQGEA